VPNKAFGGPSFTASGFMARAKVPRLRIRPEA